MPAKLVIELSPTQTGKVLGDFTWDFCKRISDDSAVSTAGCALVEYGYGTYSLYNPNVVADTAFRLHLTADATQAASGIFSLADDDTARQSSLALVPTDISDLATSVELATTAAALSADIAAVPADVWDVVLIDTHTSGDLLRTHHLPDYEGPIIPMPANIDPDTQFVHFFGRRGDNTLAAGRKVVATPLTGQYVTPFLVDKQVLSAELNASGYAHLTLLRGLQYEISANWWGPAITITVTDASERQFIDYVVPPEEP